MNHKGIASLRGAIAMALGGVLAGAAAAGAQTVEGTLLDEATDEPLAGAFIQLEDSTGAHVAGVLADEEGHFTLRAPGPGVYRVGVDLIGYTGTHTFVDLPQDRTVRLALAINVEAVSLGGVRASVGERCHRRPGVSEATARLWDETRKALEIARWGDRQRVLRFQVVEYEREVEARTLEVLTQSEHGRRGYYDESPYRSVAVERLTKEGFIRQDSSGQWEYFAPDAEVLLSDPFLDTHCFRTIGPSPEDSTLVGLAIEPIPGRDLPEIEGVLWVDRGTAELRHLEFNYVNIPFHPQYWPNAGGVVEFDRLATGMWIIRRWRLRMPLRAERRQDRGRVEAVSLLEQGAEIRSVRTAGGQLLSEAVGATLYGRAQRLDGTPLANGTVHVLAEDAEARTGRDGAFRLRGLPGGTWAVNLYHPSLEVAGLPPEQEVVRLEPGRATRLDFRIGFDARRADDQCATRGWPSYRGRPVLLHGRVLAADGRETVPGAAVEIDVGDLHRSAVTDATGVYRVCLEPTDEPVRITAYRPDDVADPAQLPWDEVTHMEARIPEPGYVRVDLTVPVASEPGQKGAGEDGGRP